MRKKFPVNQTDMDAFYEAIKGTKPLRPSNKIPLKPHPSPQKTPTRPHFNQFDFKENQDVKDVSGEEFIVFKRSGISHKTLRILQKGQYNVDAMLDLHGMRVEEAERAVDHFLQHCLRKKCKVVLIIHGKGHQQLPVLKNKLNHWLRGINSILAFCSAAPSHGNRGAIYVLLKRNIKETDFE